MPDDVRHLLGRRVDALASPSVDRERGELGNDIGGQAGLEQRAIAVAVEGGELGWALGLGRYGCFRFRLLEQYPT
jgi:hypothetical protein